MTNPTHPGNGESIGATRVPVKIVEHPAFRGHRRPSWIGAEPRTIQITMRVRAATASDPASSVACSQPGTPLMIGAV
jgi:hypothetical protein